MYAIFVRCDEFFDRPKFTANTGSLRRQRHSFVFSSKSPSNWRVANPAIQVLPARLGRRSPGLHPRAQLPFATVLTIHRLAEQGSFWGLDFALTNLPQRFFSLRGVEFFGRLNFLKAGIVFAERVTTVSEHHKQEILQPEGGYKLDVVLRENARKLSGILHGADYARWNPANDPLLPAHFDSEKLRGKTSCRDALLADLGLASAPRGPVFGMVARVVAKGFRFSPALRSTAHG